MLCRRSLGLKLRGEFSQGLTFHGIRVSEQPMRLLVNAAAVSRGDGGVCLFAVDVNRTQVSVDLCRKAPRRAVAEKEE